MDISTEEQAFELCRMFYSIFKSTSQSRVALAAAWQQLGRQDFGPAFDYAVSHGLIERDDGSHDSYTLTLGGTVIGSRP